MSETKWLDIEQVQFALRCSKSNAYAMASRQGWCTLKIGRVSFYLLDDVEKAMSERFFAGKDLPESTMLHVMFKGKTRLQYEMH